MEETITLGAGQRNQQKPNKPKEKQGKEGAGKAEEDRKRECHTRSKERRVCNLAVSKSDPGSSEDEYLSAGAQSSTSTNAPWCRG